MLSKLILFLLLSYIIYEIVLVVKYENWEEKEPEKEPEESEFQTHFHDIEYGKSKLKLKHLEDGDVLVDGITESFFIDDKIMTLPKGKYIVNLKKGTVTKLEDK